MKIINYLIILICISSIVIGGNPVGPEIGTCINPPCDNCSCSADTCIGQTCNSGQCAGTKDCINGTESDGESNDSIDITVEGSAAGNGGGGGGGSTAAQQEPCTGKVVSCPEWPPCEGKRIYRLCSTDCGGVFEDFKDCPSEEVVVSETQTEEPEGEVIVEFGPTEEKEWQWWEIIPWAAIINIGIYIISIIFLIIALIILYTYFKNRPKKIKLPKEEKKETIIRPISPPPNIPEYIPKSSPVKPIQKTPLDEFDAFIEKQNQKLNDVLDKSKKQYNKLNKVDKTVSKLSFKLNDTRKRLNKAKDNLKRKF